MRFLSAGSALADLTVETLEARRNIPGEPDLPPGCRMGVVIGHNGKPHRGVTCRRDLQARGGVPGDTDLPAGCREGVVMGTNGKPERGVICQRDAAFEFAARGLGDDEIA